MINRRYEIRRSSGLVWSKLQWFYSPPKFTPPPQSREFIPAALRHAKTHGIIKASYFTAPRRPQCLGEEYGLLRAIFILLPSGFLFSSLQVQGTTAAKRRERKERKRKGNEIRRNGEKKFRLRSLSPRVSGRPNPVNRRVSGFVGVRKVGGTGLLRRRQDSQVP